MHTSAWLERRDAAFSKVITAMMPHTLTRAAPVRRLLTHPCAACCNVLRKCLQFLKIDQHMPSVELQCNTAATLDTMQHCADTQVRSRGCSSGTRLLA